LVRLGIGLEKILLGIVSLLVAGGEAGGKTGIFLLIPNFLGSGRGIFAA